VRTPCERRQNTNPIKEVSLNTHWSNDIWLVYYLSQRRGWFFYAYCPGSFWPNDRQNKASWNFFRMDRLPIYAAYKCMRLVVHVWRSVHPVLIISISRIDKASTICYQFRFLLYDLFTFPHATRLICENPVDLRKPKCIRFPIRRLWFCLMWPSLICIL